MRAGRQEHVAHEPLINRETAAEMPLTGLSLIPCRPPNRGTICRRGAPGALES